VGVSTGARASVRGGGRGKSRPGLGLRPSPLGLTEAARAPVMAPRPRQTLPETRGNSGSRQNGTSTTRHPPDRVGPTWKNSPAGREGARSSGSASLCPALAPPLAPELPRSHFPHSAGFLSGSRGGNRPSEEDVLMLSTVQGFFSNPTLSLKPPESECVPSRAPIRHGERRAAEEARPRDGLGVHGVRLQRARRAVPGRSRAVPDDDCPEWLRFWAARRRNRPGARLWTSCSAAPRCLFLLCLGARLQYTADGGGRGRGDAASHWRLAGLPAFTARLCTTNGLSAEPHGVLQCATRFSRVSLLQVSKPRPSDVDPLTPGGCPWCSQVPPLNEHF
jgi:hypothetical protein